MFFPSFYFYFFPFCDEKCLSMKIKTEVRVDSLINSDLRTHIVGRRLADVDLSSSGEIGTDREDSPLQSKRSSMFHNFFYHSP
jgi:hypothetical protein